MRLYFGDNSREKTNVLVGKSTTRVDAAMPPPSSHALLGALVKEPSSSPDSLPDSLRTVINGAGLLRLR